ncbi:glycosyltransferase family 2 protein [Xanthomonas campestris pv. olitorii]|uniref:glycosyltransferase family 2 protein n=1 Tax=Xanthomonas TaxID=338 RepID=UPI000EFEAC70|nr:MULTISPECIES: glycosyltransferase family 2 protein [Xanthomonas]WVK03405.1 glycosyltransferase family 2 protein [Xanthomonas campestris pv. olitorii]AYO94459.1 glycosyltransferase [Xanthomonas axonopodis pv. commiphoreae]MBV6787928.1 glycosyltransferase family 2 protein [Xanthomonas campestris pv. clerodendri]MBV6805043.1 glycosyltransferase family 2 protein [Xanthomonas campestris pv. convolvuli]MBV6854958.1 glycosyltransferase family 2 protein [Xanthomonas campestris pv. mirabilis]
MAAQTLDLSIVIPVYRSESILPRLAEQLEKTLLPLYGDSFEVILVNDFSPDKSWQALQEIAATRPWWKIINLRKNAGQHNAILTGLRMSKGRYVVTMDDDLQHSPSDIPELIASLDGVYDVSYAKFHSKQHALWKRLGSRFNDLVANKLLGKPKGLYLSPFKAMVGGVRDEIVKFTGPHVYLDGLILSSTSRITTITIDHHQRIDGQSGYSLRKSISLWLKMATSFSLLPLRAASLTGIIFASVGFLLALGFIVQRFTVNAMPVGWSSLMVSALILGGVQLMAVGIIGEYVGRVLLHVNGRPQSSIESTYNIDTGNGA